MSAVAKMLESVPAPVASAIRAQFPGLAVIRAQAANEMQRVAVSVHDHWLVDPGEWHLLDCESGPERERRDALLLAHWVAIFDATDVYTLRFRGRFPRKARLVLKRYANRARYLEQCRCGVREVPRQFVVLPEYSSIYAASWDDTNVVYFNDRARVEPLLELARGVGLHCLGFDD